MKVLPFISKHRSIYLRFTALGIAVVMSFALVQMTLLFPHLTARHLIIPLLLGTTIGLMLSTLVALRREMQLKQGIFSAVADLAQEFIYVRRVDGAYDYVSPSCLQTTGYRQQDFYAQPNLMSSLIHEDDRPAWDTHVHQMHEQGNPEKLIVRIRTPAGEIRWLEHLCGDVRDENGRILGVRSTNLDITERILKEQQLWIAATAFETHEAILVTDVNSTILRVNRAFCAITGYEADEVIGKTPALLRSGTHDRNFYDAMWASLLSTGEWSGEMWDRRKNGELYPKHLTITAVKDDLGKTTHYVGIFSDISARKKTEAEINRLAYYDPLTQLPNRRLMMDRLRQAMAASQRNDSYGALLFIDMDNFKELNETQGHDAGDKLLVNVGNRLMSCVRTGDTVARMGGDEFVVMLANLVDTDVDLVPRAESVAEKVLFMLNQPYLIDGREYLCTASIGITLFHGEQQSTEELLKHTDLALYQAKNSGRATLRFFDASMQQALEARTQLKTDLRCALQEAQFQLYFQPQMDASGRCVGAEVLLRWQHPLRGLIQPNDFIPFAEECGLIALIDYWVLGEACQQLSAWSTQDPFAGMRLAVNISASAFMRASFVEDVLAIIKARGCDPRQIKLELTETSLVHNINEAIGKMNRLKSAGIKFSLDDFGTGYSSLSYLRQLPIQQLKIDRAFVRNVTTESGDAVIVRTMVGMAQNLGLDVIAEGVETEAQLSLLKSYGCPGYQGYLFSKPLNLEGFVCWVNDAQQQH
ncbi:MAG: EAL domain-containing protein [Gallionella sp.]|nr:EAL domain-containing protein [Gallionella sp.]